MQKKDLEFLSELVEAPSPPVSSSRPRPVFRDRLAERRRHGRDQRHGLGARAAQGHASRRRLGHARRPHRRDRPDGQLHHARGLHRRSRPSAGWMRRFCRACAYACTRATARCSASWGASRSTSSRTTSARTSPRSRSSSSTWACRPTRSRSGCASATRSPSMSGSRRSATTWRSRARSTTRWARGYRARVLEEVKKAGGATGDLIAAATVQEEVGLRGGTTRAYGVDPEVGIAVEVGHATDYPDIDKRKHGEATCGDGPIIARGPNINPALFELLVKAADKAKVPLPDRRRASRHGYGRQRDPALARRQGRRRSSRSRCATCTRRPRCCRSRTSTTR